MTEKEETNKRPQKIIELPNRVKKMFLPPNGYRFILDNKYVYEVCYRNIGKARFSARFVGTKVEKE